MSDTSQKNQDAITLKGTTQETVHIRFTHSETVFRIMLCPCGALFRDHGAGIEERFAAWMVEHRPHGLPNV